MESALQNSVLIAWFHAPKRHQEERSVGHRHPPNPFEHRDTMCAAGTSTEKKYLCREEMIG
eukprot:1478136-Pleurochrysis_carterae.AAC.1